MPSRPRNAGVDRETVLRRLGIVLREVPPATYLRMMGLLDDETSRSIQRVISALGVIEPEERKTAFELFNASLNQESDQFATDDSLHLSDFKREPDSLTDERQDVVSPISHGEGLGKQVKRFQQAASPKAMQELAFLNNVNKAKLAHLLEGEHPQTVALVLASIQPSVAAELLRTFQPDLQHKVMVRLSRLSNIPHAAFEEAAAHFKMRINQQVEDQEINLGVKALKAIMDVMPTDADEKVCNRRQLSSLDQVVGACTPETTMTGHNTSPRLHAAPASMASQNEDGGDDHVGVESSQEDVSGDDQWTDEEVHQHLIHLNPKDFCLALSHVPTHEALLVLCGIPAGVANRVIALLSRSQAKSVRKKMVAMKSISLQEIDDAKFKVSNLARDITRRSMISSKSA